MDGGRSVGHPLPHPLLWCDYLVDTKPLIWSNMVSEGCTSRTRRTADRSGQDTISPTGRTRRQFKLPLSMDAGTIRKSGAKRGIEPEENSGKVDYYLIEHHAPFYCCISFNVKVAVR